MAVVFIFCILFNVLKSHRHFLLSHRETNLRARILTPNPWPQILNNLTFGTIPVVLNLRLISYFQLGHCIGNFRSHIYMSRAVRGVLWCCSLVFVGSHPGEVLVTIPVTSGSSGSLSNIDSDFEDINCCMIPNIVPHLTTSKLPLMSFKCSTVQVGNNVDFSAYVLH